MANFLRGGELDRHMRDTRRIYRRRRDAPVQAPPSGVDLGYAQCNELALRSGGAGAVRGDELVESAPLRRSRTARPRLPVNFTLTAPGHAGAGSETGFAALYDTVSRINATGTSVSKATPASIR